MPAIRVPRRDIFRLDRMTAPAGPLEGLELRLFLWEHRPAGEICIAELVLLDPGELPDSIMLYVHDDPHDAARTFIRNDQIPFRYERRVE